MYNIVKDLVGTGCGHDYATKSGWYIVENYHDGRVKISEYSESTNTWGDDITVDEEDLIINGKVLNTLHWASKTYHKFLLKKGYKLIDKLKKLIENTDIVPQEYDLATVVDYYMQAYDFELFADELKQAGLSYVYIEDKLDPKNDLTPTQYEMYKLLEDN